MAYHRFKRWAGAQMSIHPRELKSGKIVYDVVYRDHVGKQRSKVHRTKYDAEQFEATTRADMVRGDWIDPTQSRERVAAWGERWLATKEDKSKAHLLRCKGILNNQILPWFGQAPIGNVSHADVQAWLASDLKDFSSSTRQKARGSLKEIFDLAVLSGALKQNPVQHTKVTADSKTERRFLSIVEIDVLANEISRPQRHTSRPYDTDRHDLSLLVRVAAFTGMRRGEIFALHTRNTDFQTGRVLITESVSEAGGRTELKPPKSGKSRSVHMPMSLAAELKAHVDGRDGIVFCNRDGGFMRGTFMKRHYTPAAARAGLLPLRFHDLRHTYAALMIAAGRHVKEIQMAMGHATSAFTMDQYGHLLPSLGGETMAGALDQLIAPVVVEPVADDVHAQLSALADRIGFTVTPK